MKLGFTGHRPNKLGGYSEDNARQWITGFTNFLERGAQYYDSVEVISGMALGVDQWVAEAALNLNLPLHAYIPFPGQENAWPASSQQVYRKILNQATTTTTVSQGPYNPSFMQIRNQAMVDAADRYVAIWDQTSGGTANCVAYARKQKRPLTVYNPQDFLAKFS